MSTESNDAAHITDHKQRYAETLEERHLVEVDAGSYREMTLRKFSEDIQEWLLAQELTPTRGRKGKLVIAYEWRPPTAEHTGSMIYDLRHLTVTRIVRMLKRSRLGKPPREPE